MYKFSADDVPVLGISLEVSIPHQLIFLQNSHPIVFTLFLLSDFTQTTTLELLHCKRVCVEVLQDYILEERHFSSLLVKCDFYV